MLLEQIHDPSDVRKLNDEQARLLCRELRTFLLEQVSRTGGHLASNLGVVELTVAIHRVFDTSKDRLVFDVGHQCYVHKALTGRRELFGTLRQLGGLSGFPKPWESPHDAFIAGHASNSVSVALGMARARTLLHQHYQVLALIGDGALGGGLSFEGLNDAGASHEPMIVILNDNGMSIDPNVGGMSRHLSRLRSKPGYYAFKKRYRQVLENLRGLSPRPVEALHVIGGGSRNDLLNQWTANAVGIPVVAGPSEATAIGNVMIQALTAGAASDVVSMRQLINRSIPLKTFTPENVEVWNAAYLHFLQLA